MIRIQHKFHELEYFLNISPNIMYGISQSFLVKWRLNCSFSEGLEPLFWPCCMLHWWNSTVLKELSKTDWEVKKTFEIFLNGLSLNDSEMFSTSPFIKYVVFLICMLCRKLKSDIQDNKIRWAWKLIYLMNWVIFWALIICNWAIMQSNLLSSIFLLNENSSVFLQQKYRFYCKDEFIQ